MIDKKTLKKSFAPLEEAGWMKKGQSWYLDGKDAIVVVNLQKYDFGESYFINIGIWLKALGDTAYPKVNLCHVYLRAENLFPEQRELILFGCSLEHNDVATLDSLSHFIKTSLIPLCRECTDKSNLRTFLSEGRFERGLVRQEARDCLSRQSERCV
jgi:Domain of unknown function (DUF4304)